MRSPAARALIALGALAAVIVLFVVFGGGDDDSTPSTTSATQTTQGPTGTTTSTDETPPPPRPKVDRIVIRNAKPVGGVKELSYENGDRVRFRVSSDTADEVHLHGYDISKELPAGGSVLFSFPASIEGVFEIELEQRAVPIAELRVNPK